MRPSLWVCDVTSNLSLTLVAKQIQTDIHMRSIFLACSLLTVLVQFANAQKMQPKDTEIWTPKPARVQPGASPQDPPSDAIILFNGNNLDEWVSSGDTTQPARWTVKDDHFVVNKGTGNIQTKRKFLDYQLHIEWRIPEDITGKDQARGNSGVFLALNDKGDGYEIQVLDNYENETYVNGQAGSIYKQSIPLVNACREPGAWQTYDIIWTAPRFDKDGKLISPARVTALHNGVLIQNNYEVKGITQYIGHPHYKVPHGASPILLQDHGDPSEPISYRNIWIRPL